MPIITCPHCGVRRNTPLTKLPGKVTEARCPQCNQAFTFDPAPYLHQTTAKKVANQHIICPHCGLPRAIPKHRQTDERAAVSCRRCQHSFRIEQGELSTSAVTKETTPRQLLGIGRLLADSWELFCHRGWGLLAIYLLASLLIFAPLLLIPLILPELTPNTPLRIWSYLLFALIYGLLGCGWITASMFSHISNQQLGVFAALAQGRRQLWKFTGLLLLLGLIIAGGSLLLIVPGIIFIVWFCFCQFILAEEDISGLQALEKSRQLVRGHWWQVFGRLLLLMLVILAISVLTARLPVIGASLNFAFSLLLTPFSLLYYYLLYRDLKRCQQQPGPAAPASQWLPLTTALLGWLLIPTTLLFFVNNRHSLATASFAKESSAIVYRLLLSGQDSILEQAEQQTTQRKLPPPEALSLADYDRILNEQQLTVPQQGVNLGPATLAAEHFWDDEREPHLWLKLQLANLPNLALSHRRSTRILIDEVLDAEAKNRYNPEHSFENNVFHWVDILPSGTSSDGYGGIRNVYLKQGTRPEQIRSISGQLELRLPLGIETLQLDRSDIGKTMQIAGKSLTLKTLNSDGIALNFSGELAELLSIRAVNLQNEPLREAGTTWQQNGQAINFKQMFSGNIDTITILVASASVTRSYPFEITR